MQDILIIALVAMQVITIILLFLFKKDVSQKTAAEVTKQFERRQAESDIITRREIAQTTADSINNFSELFTRLQSAKMNDIQTTLSEQLGMQEKRFNSFALENEQKLESIRKTVEARLQYIQNDNNTKLDEMRKIVDEKLQKTLEEKMNESFKLVSERLEQVYKGLGEMQNLAVGVGDLKKVLSNVKSRGILGELQLGAILEDILAPGQYDVNVVTKKSSKAYVEYAVKIPSEDGSYIYLPIDSKFPADAYADLQDAYANSSSDEVAAAWAVLQKRIKSFAKDIRDKYVDPPNTTEFAIMFLPFEGLYAEVVNRGMVEVLQREYHVNIAGPSTMAALLNSLQMGFRTFEIQKRSGEVWKILEAVKTEFDSFAAVLLKTQERLEQANKELDKLVGVRTRQIQRKLKDVTRMGEDESAAMLYGSPAQQLAGGFDDEAEEEVAEQSILNI